jgi:murein DD-endopeptidase MepM/ murein hydrolase activator NlpD
MKRILLIAVTLLLYAPVFAQDYSNIFKNFSFKRFNDFNTEVLNGDVSKERAVKMFDSLVKAIIYYEEIKNEANLSRKSWVFPLQGYDYRAIGGTNGNGYSDKGYKYLDGNKHLAHPAHDIFIRDKNQDCTDDKTGKPVNVLAVDDGIVVACANDWDPASNLRGGKYIWIYHPYDLAGYKSPYHFGSFTYYAHNRAIFVKPGDRVKQGQKIAEVGRTGYSAYKKRSPTHLHFSAFHIINGLPVPFNPYTELKNALKQ